MNLIPTKKKKYIFFLKVQLETGALRSVVSQYSRPTTGSTKQTRPTM